MMKTKIASRIISVIKAIFFTVVIGLVLYWLSVPPINIQSGEFCTFILVILTILISLLALGDDNIGKEKSGDSAKGKVNTYVWIVLVLVVLSIIVICRSCISALQEDNGSQLEATDCYFDGDIGILYSSSDVFIVNQKVAQIVGNRTLDTIQNAEWYDANDEYYLIKIRGEEYIVSPIEYGGFFEYIKANEQGIPGYILLNDKTQEAKVVQLDEGIKYSPSAFWSYDLARHLRNQYPSYIFGKSFFEVDDEMTPYWITSVQTRHGGFFGAKITTSVIVTNAITGESIEYTVEKLPEWVDHVESAIS